MKRILLSIVFAFCAIWVSAQDMAKVFTSMPDTLIPQLEEAWRKDLIDLFQNKKEAKLKNTMNGFSELNNLTADYLQLQLTERSSIELKLLPLVNNTYIICMVTTVSGPVADSRVAFYSTDWKELPAGDLLTPVADEWFLREDADTASVGYIQAVSRLDVDLIKYSLNAEELTLTAEYTTPLYLSAEEREKVAPFLKESPKVYRWKTSRFE
ncbi:DUF3256 family protein [Parabacteroides sp. Marseille-P3160]|uniref:DUF3256 family protein n=1 Tax=Parabacteroides sp. Marseille-P3160 TaxID=1917887 RepID=UPI0009BAB12A|nr:DUF3256 family protein [Parabacteroides sp. Marseille-P3160]